MTRLDCLNWRKPVELRLYVLDIELAVDRRELQVCDLVDLAQSVEAHLADPRRADLTAGTHGRGFDPADQVADRLERDRPFVRGPFKPVAYLVAVEGLTRSVALEDEECLDFIALVRCKSVIAARALAPPPNGSSFSRAS